MHVPTLFFTMLRKKNRVFGYAGHMVHLEAQGADGPRAEGFRL